MLSQNSTIGSESKTPWKQADLHGRISIYLLQLLTPQQHLPKPRLFDMAAFQGCTYGLVPHADSGPSSATMTPAVLSHNPAVPSGTSSSGSTQLHLPRPHDDP